jgi:hypothetical protein
MIKSLFDPVAMKKVLNEGKINWEIEAILEFLKDLGKIPEDLKEKIKEEKDLQILSRWHKLSARANSIEDFIQKSKIMDKL